MMTERRKMRLRTKIQESRSRLMEDRPFYALLLMYLKFVAVPGMKKISTNGRCIYFSPDFLDKLYGYEMDYILCHQILHILLGHIWRSTDKSGDNYHFACDIQINSMFRKSGFLRNEYPHLGYTYSRIPAINKDVFDMPPEEIHARLPYSLYLLDERTRSRYLSDSEAWWDEKEDHGLSGELILDIPADNGMIRAFNSNDEASGNTSGEGFGGKPAPNGDLQKEWQARAASAVNFMNSKNGGIAGAGDIPDAVKRIVSHMTEATVDWRTVLNNFVQERVCDYSFSPPDRRFQDTGFFLPDFNENDYAAREILFMVDTSGSVDDAQLAAVYSEIRGAIEQFNGKLEGKLGFFDREVTPPLPFAGIQDLLRIVPYRGGGTDFRAVFEYIRNHASNGLPACVVIFTDGMGPYPSQRDAMGIPVLWMINNMLVTPPWGRTVRVVEQTKD